MNQVSSGNTTPKSFVEPMSDPLASVAASRINHQALTKSLKDAGLNPQGIDSLNRQQLGELLELLQRGDKTQALVFRMVNAVAERNAERVPQLIAVLSSYGGSFPVLGEFLMRVRCDDPFEATNRAQILYLPADQLPTSRGASGHVLKGTTYCAYDKGAPADSIGFFSKRQAIAKIFEAFNQDRFNAETRTDTRERRTRILREELYNVTLDDFEANPELKKDFHSPLLVRNLAVYDELRKAIHDYQEQINSLLHAGVVTLPNKGSLRVSQDAGRQLLGWFEDHLKEDLNVPQGIRIAYENLRDPDIYLSPQEEREWLRGLLAYQRLHTYIDKSVALGGMARDLAEYDNLPQNDPLRLNSAVVRARHEIQAFSESSKTEISIAEYAKVIELAGLVEFRRSVNERILLAYGRDFNEALEYFDFVSFKDGKRLPDSYQESVPMDRLKEHVLGAKVGVAQSHYGDDKKQSVLGQRDFRAIAEAQNLFRMTNSRDKALIAWPINEFRELIRGVIVAYRKAQHFDSELAKYLSSPTGTGKEICREVVGEALQGWKPTVLTGTKWLPSEYLIDERGFEQAFDARELVARASDRGLGGAEYRKHRYEIEQQIQTGLVADKFGELIVPLQKRVAHLVPALLYRDLLDRATRVLAHPMVETEYRDLFCNLGKRYLDLKDLTLVKGLVEVESRLQALSHGKEAQLGALLDARRNLRSLSIFKGEFRSDENGREIAFAALSHEVIFEPQKLGIVTIYNPARIESVQNHLNKEYLSVRDLGDKWITKLKFICSNRGQGLLQQAGINLVSDQTFAAAQQLRVSAYTLVNRSFASSIAALYDKYK